MANPISILHVEIGDNEWDVPVYRVDYVRAERTLQISVGKLEGATGDYQFGWAICRYRNIGNVPDDFDKFLELDPDVELRPVEDENAGGKSSGQDQPTGSS